MSLVVTGASGALGRLVVAALLDRVAASELILVTRSPDSLGDVARLGATVRYGDFEKPGSLPAAFAGGRRMLVISTIGAADTAAAHRAAFEAAANAQRGAHRLDLSLYEFGVTEGAEEAGL